MAVPGIVPFLGKYAKIYKNEEEAEKDQVQRLENDRSEFQRFFESVIGAEITGKSSSLVVLPAHPAAASVHQISAQFDHISDFILKVAVKEKDPKKLEPIQGFFSAWPYVSEICKFAKIDKEKLQNAIGLDLRAGKKVVNPRLDWVTLLYDLNERFSGNAPYLLQGDFDRMIAIIRLDPEVCIGFEGIFARYMVLVSQQLHLLQQILHDVLHRKK